MCTSYAVRRTMYVVQCTRTSKAYSIQGDLLLETYVLRNLNSNTKYYDINTKIILIIIINSYTNC